MGRRQQSVPIEVALDMDVRGTVLTLVGAIACKSRVTCLRITLRELDTFDLIFDDFVCWAAHQSVFSVS